MTLHREQLERETKFAIDDNDFHEYRTTVRTSTPRPEWEFTCGFKEIDTERNRKAIVSLIYNGFSIFKIYL